METAQHRDSPSFYLPEARGISEETQMTPLKSIQNRPIINTKYSQNRPRIDPESSQNQRRIDPEPLGNLRGSPPGDPPRESP